MLVTFKLDRSSIQHWTEYVPVAAINNVDFSIFKNFRFGESKYIQIRADFFNVFNHPQYVPGSVNSVDPVNTTGLTTLNQVNPLTLDFLNPSAVLSSNPRVIQLAARFNF
jgi:hypothetical protein